MAATIVDVLRTELGDLDKIKFEELGTPDLDALAEAINAFYTSWSSPGLLEGDLRVYSGGWIAGNTTVALARKYLLSSLLYAPSVVIHEPLADWFDPDRAGVKGLPPIKGRGMSFVSSEPDTRRADGYFKHRGAPDRTHAVLAAAVPTLVSLEPLLQDGTVVAVPQWQVLRQRQMPILTAVRKDVQNNAFAALVAANGALPRSDQVRGMAVTPADAVLASEQLRAAVQDPAYFFHKTAAIADATASRYMPPAPPDAALLEFKLNAVRPTLRRHDLDLRVVSALNATALPFLSNVDVATIVAIRTDEEAFADWRSELRTVARTIGALPTEGDAFLQEAESALADALLPRAHELRLAVSKSTTMTAALGPTALTFGVQAASLVGADLVTGTPFDVAGLTALGLGTAASWLLAGLFRGSGDRPHGVLATLVADWDPHA